MFVLYIVRRAWRGTRLKNERRGLGLVITFWCKCIIWVCQERLWWYSKSRCLCVSVSERWELLNNEGGVIIPVLRYGHYLSFFGVESNIAKLRPMVQRAEILSKHTVQVDRTLIWIKQGGVVCKKRDRRFNICSNVIKID